MNNRQTEGLEPGSFNTTYGGLNGNIFGTRQCIQICACKWSRVRTLLKTMISINRLRMVFNLDGQMFNRCITRLWRLVNSLKTRNMMCSFLQRPGISQMMTSSLRRIRELEYLASDTSRKTGWAGRVAIFFRSYVRSAPVSVPMTTTFECVCSRFKTSASTFTIIAMYRPGSVRPTLQFYYE